MGLIKVIDILPINYSIGGWSCGTNSTGPALVLTTRGDDVIILGIFSKIPDEFRDSWIKIDEVGPNFGVTGLKKTSIIKTEKIAVIHRSLIRKELGHLSQELLQRVKKTLLKTLEIE